MRTTVRLEDSLLRQAKGEAERRGETLTAMIESGLRLVLAQRQPERRRKKIVLPVSPVSGGVRPGVDLSDGAALLDIMEGRR